MGFKSQFTMAYRPRLLSLSSSDKGYGAQQKLKTEGIRYKILSEPICWAQF